MRRLRPFRVLSSFIGRLQAQRQSRPEMAKETGIARLNLCAAFGLSAIYPSLPRTVRSISTTRQPRRVETPPGRRSTSRRVSSSRTCCRCARRSGGVSTRDQGPGPHEPEIFCAQRLGPCFRRSKASCGVRRSRAHHRPVNRLSTVGSRFLHRSECVMHTPCGQRPCISLGVVGVGADDRPMPETTPLWFCAGGTRR